jgi:hypothetical protein
MKTAVGLAQGALRVLRGGEVRIPKTSHLEVRSFSNLQRMSETDAFVLGEDEY